MRHKWVLSFLMWEDRYSTNKRSKRYQVVISAGEKNKKISEMGMPGGGPVWVQDGLQFS